MEEGGTHLPWVSFDAVVAVSKRLASSNDDSICSGEFILILQRVSFKLLT